MIFKLASRRAGEIESGGGPRAGIAVMAKPERLHDPVVLASDAMPHAVLSVDADTAVCSERNELLRAAGFHVIDAATAADALQLALENQPALVVLAIELPGMDGFAVCERLKADSRTASIPVLHISGRGAFRHDYPESLRSGAEAYLQSPVQATVLIDVVKALIHAASGGTAPRRTDGLASDILLALIDSIPDEVWFADTKGRFTLANPAAAREFGASTLVGVEDLARSLEVYRADGSPRPVEEAPPLRALRGETVQNQEEIVRTPSHGELRYRRVSASPVRDSTGNIIGSVSVVRDVTERKLAGEALRCSEERLRLTLDGTGLGTFEYRPETGESWWDAGAKAAWGLPEDAEVALPQLLERIHPEDRSRIRAALEAALQPGSPASSQAEYRVIWPDGSVHWIAGRSRTFFVGEGGARRATRMIGVHQDITARKLAEEALRASEERHRLLADTMLQGVVYQDADGKVVDMNPAAERILGKTREEFPGSSWLGEEHRTVSEDGSPFPGLEHPAMAVLRSGQPLRGVVVGVFNPRAGAYRWISIDAVPVFRPGETPPFQVHAVFEDITERKEAEEALRRSEAVLRAFFDSPQVMQGIVEIVEGAVVHVASNEAASEMFGFDRGSIAGKSATQAGAPEEIAQKWLGLYEESRRTGKPVSMEYVRRRADGQERYLLATASYLGTGPSVNPRFAYAILDLTEHRRAEEALRESEARYRTVLDSITDGLLVLDKNWRYTYFSEHGARMIGMRTEDLIGGCVWDLFPHAQETKFWEGYHRAVETGQPVEFEEYYPEPLNKWFECRCYPSPEGLSVYFHDITESKRAKEALRESDQRLRTLSDNLPDGAIYRYRLDAGGQPHVDLISAGIERLTGVPAAEYLADAAAVERNIVPEDHARLHAAIALSRERLIRFDIEFRHIHRVTGETRWSLLRSTPTRCPDGSTVWDGVEIDITERKRAEEAWRESEKVYRAIGESIDYGVWVCDPDGRNTYASESFLKLVGLTQEQCSSFGWGDVLHPDDAERTIAAWKECVRTQGRWDIEHRFRGVDGKSNSILARGVPVRDEQGRVTSWVGINLDISARKLTEESLRESEERFRALVTATSEVVYRMNPDWSEMRHLRGRDFIADTETPSGAWLQKYIHPDDPPRVIAAIEKAVRTRNTFELEHRVLRVDGTLGWTYSRAIPLRDANGEIVEWLGAASDITERKRAELEIERQARLLGQSYEPMFAWDFDGTINYWNNAAETLYGFSREEAMGRFPHELLGTVHPIGMAQLDAILASAGSWTGELLQTAKYGRRILIETVMTVGADPDGRGVVLETCRDITERKLAQEALAASESRFRALLDSASQGVVAIDESGRMVLVNAKTEEMFGYTRDELLLQPLDVLLPERYRTAHGGHLRDYFARPHTRAMGLGMDLSGRAKDGKEFPLEVSLSCIEQGESRLAMALITDITERKNAEKRLLEAQKLESLGLLAGGVAHDFNNLLVGVIGNASLAQEMLPAGHPAADRLDGVLKAGEQAAHLTRQMLAYAGKGRFVVEPLDLSVLIPEMSGLVRPSIAKKIALRLDLDPDLPPIEADRGQVQQVFMNLALNAGEAIGSQEGTITVRTGVQEVDEHYLRLHPETAALRPGKYVCLEVRDTGCGMDDATRAKIFDPFFSTKFVGRGLGLAAVAGILRGHKGAITVGSELGKGSCFTALFRALERTAGKPPVTARNAALRGTGTVLVVDDEPAVREVSKKALESYGYTVLLADSGLAAIDVFRRHPGEIALVVLDLSMPGMNGEEVLPELRKIRPMVKVVLSSGYSEAEAMGILKGQPVTGFIQKPYTSKGLAEKVKVCLE